jgi:hypothetical protein
MKVLIVTHNYAPDRAPRAFRWTAIAEHWAEAGMHVDVVTSGRSGGLPYERANGVHVHRVGERWNGRFRRNLSTNQIAGDITSQSWRNRIFRMAAKFAKILYNATWKRIYWPDHAILWYGAGRKQAIHLYGERDYDAVITVSHPFTGHLIGLSLKSLHPDVRWIADVGDPFSFGGTVPFNNEILYRRFNRKAEARVYARCDAISVTVDGCREAILKTFPGTTGKVQVISPLLSLPTMIRYDKPKIGNPGGIVLVYLGVLYKRIRRPDFLLSLFAALHTRNPAVELHFFGDVQDCEEDFERYPDLRGSALFTHGSVPREQVAAIMSQASVLVNIGNETSFQLPSKLVEYAGAGRPILSVSQTPSDTASDFLTEYPAALAIAGGTEGVSADQVEKVLRFIEDALPVDRGQLDSFLSRFQIDHIADAYIEMIRSPRSL